MLKRKKKKELKMKETQNKLSRNISTNRAITIYTINKNHLL